jgi:hypothetical protein
LQEIKKGPKNSNTIILGFELDGQTTQPKCSLASKKSIWVTASDKNVFVLLLLFYLNFEKEYCINLCHFVVFLIYSFIEQSLQSNAYPHARRGLQGMISVNRQAVCSISGNMRLQLSQ